MGGVPRLVILLLLPLSPAVAADTDPDDALAHVEMFAGQPDDCAALVVVSSERTSAGADAGPVYYAWAAGGGSLVGARSQGPGCIGDDTGERGAVFAAWLQDYVHRSPRSTMRTVCMLLP